MPDKTHVAIPQTRVDDLVTHFGLKGQVTVPTGVVRGLLEILSIMMTQDIDGETSVGIIKSFESKFGMHEDSNERVSKFLKFIKQIKGKEPLLQTVKSLGLLSKAELEQYALETGDWSHFLRRLEKDREDAKK